MRNKDKLDFINQIVKEAEKQCDIHVVSKRYRIQGTSFTTNGKKWFEFDEKGWQEFKTKRWTHYPAWSFDDSIITEFNGC